MNITKYYLLFASSSICAAVFDFRLLGVNLASSALAFDILLDDSASLGVSGTGGVTPASCAIRPNCGVWFSSIRTCTRTMLCWPGVVGVSGIELDGNDCRNKMKNYLWNQVSMHLVLNSAVWESDGIGLFLYIYFKTRDNFAHAVSFLKVIVTVLSRESRIKESRIFENAGL